ncbi:MAG: putative sulfate exporter family transporter [Burkholderiaceae bacterium]
MLSRAHLAAIQARLPGLAAAAALALASGWIAGGLGDPLARNPVLVAMLCGLLVNALFGCPQALRPGLDFTRRTLLRAGVALLGLRITASLLGALGPVPIVIAATELLVVLVGVRWIARRLLRLDDELALLLAVGSAVCGAAAILSFAAMSRDRERHAATAVTLITLAGTLALLAYPVAYLAGWLPGLDEHGFGVTVGASIFELAQVYGASASVSEGALGVATLVKLSKVLMLVPLMLAAGWGARDGAAGTRRGRVQVPWFVVAFIAVVALNSAITVHPLVRATLLGASQFMFMMTMVALGLSTRVGALRDWRLAAAGAVALGLSAGIAYGLVTLSSGLAAPSARPGAAGPRPIASSASAGARLFDDVGCGKCHVRALHGVHGDVVVYSDLLLHDMGPALDDKIVQGDATGADWRTTPLVGLSTHARYLHDGRAADLRAAIFDHGGEAAVVRERFFELEPAEQAQVYAFLRTL